MQIRLAHANAIGARVSWRAVSETSDTIFREDGGYFAWQMPQPTETTSERITRSEPSGCAPKQRIVDDPTTSYQRVSTRRNCHTAGSSFTLLTSADSTVSARRETGTRARQESERELRPFRKG